MAATANYTISYVAQGVIGSPSVDINIYIKENAAPSYTLAFTQTNAAVGTTYTYTFNNLNSHTVHQIKIESVCGGTGVQFGDIQYLVNPECNSFTVTPVGLSLDIAWDLYTPINGDSILEYIVEYRDVTSTGPYYSETIPIADILTYWSNNPGSYPNFIYNVTTGITPGDSFEVRLSAVIEFDYSQNPISNTFPSQLLIGPCTGAPASTFTVESLENGNPGIQENNNFSILEQ